MTKEQIILQNIQFDAPVTPQDFTYNEQLGLLTQEVYSGVGEERQIRILGFHATQDPSIEELTPITNVWALPTHRRGLHFNAKGTGIMLGNTPEVVRRPHYKGEQPPVAAWLTPPLDEHEVMQRRSRSPESIFQITLGIGKHAARAWVEARIRGEQSVISRIDSGYGSSKLVTMNPAPTWLLAQRRSRKLKQDGVTPTWALYRNSEPLKRVGEVRDY